MKNRRPLIFAFALAACSKAEAPPSDTNAAATNAQSTSATPAPNLPSDWSVTPVGTGHIVFGQTLAVVNSTLGDSLKMAKGDAEACQYLRPASAPQGLTLMVLKDTVVRVDVESTATRTAEGVGVGDDEAKIMSTYTGRVVTQPHKYTGPKGHYLVVTPPADTMHRIIFETDGMKVTKFHAGVRPSVDLVERCL